MFGSLLYKEFSSFTMSEKVGFTIGLHLVDHLVCCDSKESVIWTPSIAGRIQLMPAPVDKDSSAVLFKASALALSLLLVGCSQNQSSAGTSLNADVAPGFVLVDILEAGQPEHYWQYQVLPATGLTRMVKEQTFQDYKHEDLPADFYQPTGALESCARNLHATSPNGKYVAYCKSGPSDEFYVADQQSNETLQHWRPRKGIRGFAWAPNSNSVAILTVSGYAGMRPRELLSFISGHPVSHDTVFLDLLDMRTGTITEYVVRRNIVSSFTRILNWGQ